MVMKYKLVVTNGAQNDIIEASGWYEGKKKGLGKLLILSFEKCITLIIKNPFSFALIYLQIRKANSKKFPYSLFYIINETTRIVTIFAVIHNSRNENAWKNRNNEF